MRQYERLVALNQVADLVHQVKAAREDGCPPSVTTWPSLGWPRWYHPQHAGARTVQPPRRAFENAFAELVVWELPQPLLGSAHGLALVVDDECVLRYDNEAGKGDHKHIDAEEVAYAFSTVERLVADSFHDVTRWRDENRNT